jgi:1-acyl-sn-glycerol-3-phosphate acyltransferase
VIIACNHLSFSDHFFGPLPVPRKVVFLAKAEYFTGRGVKGLISKVFFTGVGQISIDRGGGIASEQAIRTGLRVLAAGHVLGIYPEGTRSPDGRLYRGKTGVARLAIESGAPVIPCAMIDTFQFQPPNTIWPNMRYRPGVRFGKPLDFSRYHGREADGQLLRTVTDEIMQAIAKPSGQEYVDVDAPGQGRTGWRRGRGRGLIAGRTVFPPLVRHPYGHALSPTKVVPCEWESSPAAATARD